VTNASVRSSMAASLAAVILDISPWKSRIWDPFLYQVVLYFFSSSSSFFHAIKVPY
jgi:hypothetical protein